MGALLPSDPFNRLDYSQRNGVTNLDVTLDAIGNITWKSDVGNFTYHATKRRAVVSAGSNTYDYDANGNIKTRNGSTINYASYNLPTSIPSGANSSTLAYGAWRNTVKQVAVNAGTTETTIYVAGLVEKVTKGTATEYRHRIDATPGTVAIYVRKSSGSNATYYLHRDHLGSPEMITNASGNSVVKLSFSAYGERRDVDWDGPITSSHLTSAANVTRHGYTDHLHLDSVKLVHMGGRVYDPVIGRFLSRDPYIDGVQSSQGANGYAYVWNNPLSRWDPTGYSGVGIIFRIWCNSGDCYSSIELLEQIVVTGSRLMFDPLSRFGDINVGGIDAGAGGESAGGGSSSGGAGAPEGSKEEEPQEDRPASKLCHAGNTLARAADFLGDKAAGAQVVGLGILATSPVFPAAWEPGLGLLAAGGAVGGLAAVLQLSAGVAQSAGGGEGSANIGYASIIIATGAAATRGIIGPTVSGHRTFSERAGDAIAKSAASTFGGVNSLTQALVDQAAPRQVECP